VLVDAGVDPAGLIGRQGEAELATIRNKYQKQQDDLDAALAVEREKLKDSDDAAAQQKLRTLEDRTARTKAAIAEEQAAEERQSKVNENKRLADSRIGGGQTIDQAKIGLLQQQARSGTRSPTGRPSDCRSSRRRRARSRESPNSCATTRT
jgi:hypothetical protein